MVPGGFVGCGAPVVEEAHAGEDGGAGADGEDVFEVGEDFADVGFYRGHVLFVAGSVAYVDLLDWNSARTILLKFRYSPAK